MMGVLTLPIRKSPEISDATFTALGLTLFARLDEFGRR